MKKVIFAAASVYLPFTFCRFAWRSFFYFYPPHPPHPRPTLCPQPVTRPFDPVPSFPGSFTWPLMMSLRGRGGDRQTASQTATTAEQTGLLVFLQSLRCYSKREDQVFLCLFWLVLKWIVGATSFSFLFLLFFFLFFWFFWISFPNYKFVDKWNKKRGLSDMSLRQRLWGILFYFILSQLSGYLFSNIYGEICALQFWNYDILLDFKNFVCIGISVFI